MIKRCEKCDRPMQEAGELPSLVLKALGQFPSDRMTVMGDRRTISITAATGSIAVPQAFTTDFASARITFDQNNPMQPGLLHRLPGRPIAAYPLIKDVSIFARVTAGTLVTPAVIVGWLKYVDLSDKPHIVMPIALSVPTAYAATDSSLRASNAINQSNILIVGTQLGEAPIAAFGSWVIDVAVTLGTATTIVLEIWSNLGVLYGAPST